MLEKEGHYQKTLLHPSFKGCAKYHVRVYLYVLMHLESRWRLFSLQHFYFWTDHKANKRQLGFRYMCKSHMCHGQKSCFFGDGKPPTFNRNPYNGPYKPLLLGWFSHPLLYGNNGSWWPDRTYLSAWPIENMSQCHCFDDMVLLSQPAYKAFWGCILYSHGEKDVEWPIPSPRTCNYNIYFPYSLKKNRLEEWYFSFWGAFLLLRKPSIGWVPTNPHHEEGDSPGESVKSKIIGISSTNRRGFGQKQGKYQPWMKMYTPEN